MSNRPSRKPNIFQRITKAVTSRIKKIISPQSPSTQGDLNKQENKSIIKKMIQRIRPPKTGTLSGTTKRIPVAKYSDMEIGWGKGKSVADVNKKLRETGKVLELPSGRQVSQSEMNRLEQLIEKSKERLREQRENIVSNAYKLYGDVEGLGVELQVKRAVEREERRFTNAVYDGLRDKDINKVFRDMDKSDSIGKFLDDFLEGERISAKGHAIRYRDNWAEAFMNVYGDNTTTRGIIDDVYNNLTLDTFLNTLYNPNSSLNIDFLYSEEKKAENLVKMEMEIEKLMESQDSLKPIL